MANMLSGIIYIAIALVVFAGVYMTTLKSTNTTTWSSGEVAIWGVLGIAGIAGLVIAVLNVFGVV